MGNYRQHLGFSSALGVGYAVLAHLGAGVHWVYGSVAALLAAMSGLLPDLDSGSGVELRAFTGVLGVLAALFVWMRLGHLEPPPVFETHLWAMVFAYVGVRHGIRRFARVFSVHRGMSHSFPTCGVWGALTYLYYPSPHHSLRLLMAVAVMLGFVSHLLLDEICSVDLKGARVNKAFGTAMKFWAPSIGSTLGMYALLSVLTWQVVQIWPDEPFRFTAPPPPMIPYEARARQLEALARQVGIVLPTPAESGRFETLPSRRKSLPGKVSATDARDGRPPAPRAIRTDRSLDDRAVTPTRVPARPPLRNQPTPNPPPGPSPAASPRRERVRPLPDPHGNRGRLGPSPTAPGRP